MPIVYNTANFISADLIGKPVKLFLQYYCPSADDCSCAEALIKDQSILENIIVMPPTWQSFSSND